VHAKSGNPMYVPVLLMLAAVVAAAFHFRVVLKEEP
jgi:hypothetical protein